MNILFITGSLSREHDGVADYTLRLAEALKPMGVESRFISLSERSGAPVFSEDSLRLPRHLPLSAKRAHLRHFLSGFAPDFISLQFVPFAFEARGFPFSLQQELRGLVQLAPVHIFAHELWVFNRRGEPLKYRILGPLLQKRLILSLFRALKPCCLHVALPFYAETLKIEGFAPRLLPLFGNIPVESVSRKPVRGNHRRLGFFGSISAATPLEPFFESCAKIQSQTGLELTLLSGGSLSNAAVVRWQRLAQKYRGRLQVEQLGFMSMREASYYLSSLDIFLSGYSPAFWQKSGAIAAAREHGLPVLLLSDDGISKKEPLPQGVFRELTPALLQETIAMPSPMLLPEIARSFMKDLEASRSQIK